MLFFAFFYFSYGFHKNHCIEAFEYCNGNIEDSLYLLYHKYFNWEGSTKEIEQVLTNKELLEMRMDEKSSLQSIYEKSFSVKAEDVWIFTLQLDYLVNIFHNKETKSVNNKSKQIKKEKCRNIIRSGHCKYGDKCRFSHEQEIAEVNPNKHLDYFFFELEIRFPSNTKYPYEPPLIFLKTDAVIPPLVNLHICKRLYDEARISAEDGIPCVYSLVELIQNEEEIKKQLSLEMDFISPKQKLFDTKKIKEIKEPRPSHYKKGKTNRDHKKVVNLDEVNRQDQVIVHTYLTRMKDSDKYQKMLKTRKSLPAWTLRKDIINTINQSSVVVISGETGCGKSTQVPQFILDDWIANYDNQKSHIEIVCTQPRRISAIGVADRVADERAEKIGNTVGYQIRLESKVSSNTRLTFCTTGILLRRLEGEPTLSNVTHIIVDEVHERSEER